MEEQLLKHDAELRAIRMALMGMVSLLEKKEPGLGAEVADLLEAAAKDLPSQGFQEAATFLASYISGRPDKS